MRTSSYPAYPTNFPRGCRKSSPRPPRHPPRPPCSFCRFPLVNQVQPTSGYPHPAGNSRQPCNTHRRLFTLTTVRGKWECARRYVKKPPSRANLMSMSNRPIRARPGVRAGAASLIVSRFPPILIYSPAIVLTAEWNYGFNKRNTRSMLNRGPLSPAGEACYHGVPLLWFCSFVPGPGLDNL